METIQLIRKLPDFFPGGLPDFLEDFQIVSNLSTSFSGFSFTFQTILLCAFVFQFFTIESFFLSYCNNVKCNFTFQDYMETIQFSGRLPDCLSIFTKE